MEEFLALQQKLEKIAAARKLNKRMQEVLKKRLQKIDAMIYKSTTEQQNTNNTYFYIPTLKFWGIGNYEYSKLAQLFWGKFHNRTSYQQPIETKMYSKLSRADKAILFLNQNRTSRQKSVLISKNDQCPLIMEFQRIAPPPIKLKPYGIHDIIRYYIFTKVYGPSFPIQLVYPHISSKVMRMMIKNASQNTENNPELKDIGIDQDDLKNYITNGLKNL